MKLLDFESFSVLCNRNVCPRKRLRSKKCTTEDKQIDCYERWLQEIDERLAKKEEIVVDEKWEEVKKKVWERDNGKCQLWEVLTIEQRDYVKQHYYSDHKFLSKDLDCAHIKPRGSHPDLIYDVDNIVLISRYFHSLLDQFYDPVTREPIDREAKTKWLIKARDHNG